ncbi:MAG: type II toxin-antitoxin system VapC family toxin [Thiobacillaceae bacterium]
MGYLIDTCVWIDVEQGRLAPADVAAVTGDSPVFMSPVTIAELKFGAEVARDEDVRHKRLAALQRLRRKPMLPIDGDTGEIFGRLAASLKAAGRGHRYRVQDLWLSSQAIQWGYRLLSRNGRDFQDIPGLELVLI